MGIEIVFVLVVAAAVLSWVWTYGRSRDILDQWVEENGFTLVSAERRHMFRGPFFWRTSNAQQVFRIAVRGPGGAVRQGFLRVGGWWAGLFSDKAVVEWD